MRSHPSLLLVYMGLATCLDTLPHREQNQGEYVCGRALQRFNFCLPLARILPGFLDLTLLPQILGSIPQLLPSVPQGQLLFQK